MLGVGSRTIDIEEDPGVKDDGEPGRSISPRSRSAREGSWDSGPCDWL